MTEYQPLTRELREKILKTLHKELDRLEGLQKNAYTSMWRTQTLARIQLFKGLPDGYPIPIVGGDK